MVAQNAAPYWSTSGNSNATTSSKFGTTNSIPLRMFTNNAERMRIDADGKIGIGTTLPKGKLSIQSSGGTPASIWVTSGVPIFAGFGENTAGNADHILAMASNTPSARAVFLGRKSRGTLNFPTAVQNNDYILSIFASAYDGGGSFQSPATLDFFVDGTVSSGKVPTRVSISTGSSFSDRTERLKVGSTGDINFNNGQVFVQQSSGHLGIGTTNPAYALTAIGTDYGIWGNGTYYGLIANSSSSGGYGVSAYGYFGVYGQGTKYGIYGYAPSSGYAGYFSGSVYTSATYVGSDQKLKQHIEDASSALVIIKQLKPKSYEYRQDGSFKAMNLPTGIHYGLIAQDVEKILPNLVKASSFEQAKTPPPGNSGADNQKNARPQTAAEKIDFKAVNYTELIPILVKAVQEQQSQIHQQDSTIQELKQELAKLTGGGTSMPASGSLSQNTPNPAGQLTNISYRVPDGSRQAFIAVIDNSGRLLQNIRVSGSGVAHINTAGLSGGTYHYSLIADNRVIDTRQLLIAR